LINRWLGVLLVSALFAVSGCSAKAPDPKAPGFTLNSLTGQGISLDDFQGRPVVINFWQLSCPPCIEELPHFQALYASGTKTAILTIAIRDSATALVAFMTLNGYTFPVLLDPTAAVAAEYGLRFTPTTFLIDSNGRVVDTKVGPFTSKAELEQALDKID
jgi:peroxiredoxin